jgi:PAS domain S-box-containing protein
MLAAVNVGLWYCDLPFDELAWDPTVKAHFWLPPDARVTLDTFYARLHPDDRGPTRAAVERAIAERTPYDVEYRTVAPPSHPEAGAVRWVRALGHTADDADGRPARFDGVTVDVTATRRAAERLAASEQRYEYAARATSNAIWDWDLAADRVAWTPGITTVFGHPPERVGDAGPWWYAAVHPDDRARVVRGVRAVIDGAGGGHSWTDAYRFRRGDGSYARVVDRGYVARDAAGRAVRMIGAMEDVTARHEVEERFRALVEATDQYIWTNDPEGRMTRDQPGWARLTGQAPDEYAGYGWADAVHPDDRGAHGGGVGAGGRRGRAVRGRAPRAPAGRRVARLLGARGAGARARRRGARVGGHPHRRHRAAGARGRARPGARRGAPRARAAAGGDRAGAVGHRGDRGPRAPHRGRERGLRRAHRRRPGARAPVREAFPELEGRGFFELLDRVYATGVPYAGSEVPAPVDRDGDGVPEEYVFNFTYQPLRDVDGAVRGILTHAAEVTDQVRARQEVERKAAELAALSGALARSNTELDQFAYVASHDLKAPLRGIANLAQWIEEDLGDRAAGETAEHMRLLRGRVHRMEALIDGILAYSRAGRARLAPEPVDLGALAREAAELVSPPPGRARRDRRRPADGGGRARAAPAGAAQPRRQRGEVRGRAPPRPARARRLAGRRRRGGAVGRRRRPRDRARVPRARVGDLPDAAGARQGRGDRDRPLGGQEDRRVARRAGVAHVGARRRRDLPRDGAEGAGRAARRGARRRLTAGRARRPPRR